MARGAAFSTSLCIHAATLAAVLILPLLGEDRMPEPQTSDVVATVWPEIVPVVHARARPEPARTRHAQERVTPRQPALAESASESATVPAVDAPIDASASDADADDFGAWIGTELDAVGLVASSGTAVGSTPPGAGEPLRIGGGLTPPTKLVHVQPEYPEIARVARVRGTVVLDCTIDPSGNVVHVRVLSGSPLLGPAAAEAVRRWRYTATRLNGVPVSVLMTVTVRFDLKQ